MRAEKPTFGWGQRGGSGKFAQPRHPKDGLEVGQMLSQNTSAPPARAAAALESPAAAPLKCSDLADAIEV